MNIRYIDMFFFKLSAVKQSRVFKFLPLDVDAVLQFPMIMVRELMH